jgi:hypothetical protein
MPASDSPAHVIYRAAGRDGREVEIHLALEPAAATVADAWSRLTGVCPDADPLSLEIEVREAPAIVRARPRARSLAAGFRRPATAGSGARAPRP